MWQGAKEGVFRWKEKARRSRVPSTVMCVPTSLFLLFLCYEMCTMISPVITDSDHVVLSYGGVGGAET